MTARIYRPVKSAMQSGKANTRHWVLDFEPEEPYGRDPLMGWATMTDMKQMVKLTFATKEEAIAWARAHGLAYRVLIPHDPVSRHKSYSDNFRFGRKRNWTH